MTNRPTTLSPRGHQLATNPARIDMEIFMEAAENLYHPIKNPDGAFPLNVAENAVSSELMREQFESVLAEGTLPEWTMKYTATLGHPEVREVIAAFMRKHFGSEAIEAGNLAFSAGASASLEVCSFVLGNAGDVVVIPAPSYPMYTKDLGIKSGMERYDLQTHVEIADRSTLALADIAHLERTYTGLESQGKRFKMLLITTPDNPTGCIYEKVHLERLADWCIEKKVHLVVNEIYAHSLIDRTDPEVAGEFTDAPMFQSFAGTMARYKSDYLHLIYALSKDFAISGFRFGIIHSLNEEFIRGLSNVNIPHMVSNVAQWLVGEVFKDEAFISHYIRENKRRITESYKVVTSTFQKMGIPYMPAPGSLFVWADFSKYLPEDSAKGEEDLWLAIYRQTGVLLTPGAGFQHRKHGLFRIVHTALPPGFLKAAMKKLSTFEAV